MLNPTTSSWENRLLVLAQEALENAHHIEPIEANGEVLNEAYAACTRITYTHSRTFYLASSLLPPDKRKAVRALYAFCRRSDDLVDHPIGDPELLLSQWRRRALSANPACDDPVALAWADTRARYQIPRQYAEQLIDGVARDLLPARYQTFDDLSAYCYGVASTVGLMAMHIIGFSGPEAIPYALKLGVALQMTNILRDVGEDWQTGRLYLPLEELHAFGLSEADIAEGRTDTRWVAFLDFQIERNRSLYASSLPGIALLNRDGRFSIMAAARLYQAILEDIEAHQGNVFQRRAHLSAVGKLRRLPGIWLESQRVTL